MAVSFEIRIRDLLPEFLADTLVFFGALESAGTITAGALKTILYSLDHFCIFIESDSHGESPFSFYYTPGVKGSSFLFSFCPINDTITKICLGGYL